MHRLEITGATPEDLYMNAVRMLSVLLKGGASPAEAMPVNVETPHEEITTGTTKALTVLGTDEHGTAVAETIVVPKKRGPKSKLEQVKEVLNDDISDVGGKPVEKKELTLDGDIRPRLQAIQAACTKRGMTMPQCVAYIQKLYGPFGIANAKQLKPEQFEEFLEASEAYLSGEAEA